MNKTIPSQDLIEARLRRDARLRKDPTCTKCKITKKFDDFPGGCVDYWCRDCRNEYAARAYHKRRQRMTKSEVEADKERVNKRQNRRRANRIAAMSPKELVAYRKERQLAGQKTRDEARDRVYAAYGGYICSCCGETERAFLTLDHKYNDGSRHKRECNLKTGYQMHVWIIRNNFPPAFQVLCMNCNWGKHQNKGVCPHQSGKV